MYDSYCSILGLFQPCFCQTLSMSLSSLTLIRKYMFKMKLCIMQSPTNFRLRLFLLSKETEKLQSVIYSLAVLKTIVDNEKDQLLYPHELS